MDHEHHPSRRPAGAVLPRRPAARGTRQRRRHGQRARSGGAPAESDRAGGVRIVDRRLRRDRRRRRPRYVRHSGDHLRRLQTSQRGQRLGVPRGARRCQHRPTATHGLRPGPRPGPHLGADQRDAGGRSGPRVQDPLRRHQPVPVRPRRGPRIRPGHPGRLRRRQRPQPGRTGRSRWTAWSRRSRQPRPRPAA